jgi:hypothetical protein
LVINVLVILVLALNIQKRLRRTSTPNHRKMQPARPLVGRQTAKRNAS